MSTATAPPEAPPNTRPLAHGDPPALSRITTKTRRLPSRIMLHAVQKWGKTSFAAQAPAPVFLCTRGEDGLETLIDAGQLPEVPHFPGTVQSWSDLMIALNELVNLSHPHKTLVLDTINGAIQLAQEKVIGDKFGGDFEKFDAYGRGGQRLLPYAIDLTKLIDRLREKGMATILLAHSTVRTWKNPDGIDFPRWEAPVAKEIMEHLDRWSDGILFGQFVSVVEKNDAKDKKGKALADQTRLIQVENHATFSAGNRLGMTGAIECGDSAADAWVNFLAARHAAKVAKERTATPTEAKS